MTYGMYSVNVFIEWVNKWMDERWENLVCKLVTGAIFSQVKQNETGFMPYVVITIMFGVDNFYLFI